MSEGISAIRGDVLTFEDDPFLRCPSECVRFIPDGIVLMSDGKITAVGPAKELADSVPVGVDVRRYSDAVIMAGFIDCHVHYPQTQIIGAFGKQLVDWLNKYTFVAEQAFADEQHCRESADVFLRECLRAGTTTASVYCTVHPQSVDAFFEASSRLGMRNIAGKVLMDRNAPKALTDTPQRGYDESKALIEKWHGKGRQLYAVTPRFAPTSSHEQMELAGALWHEHPGTYLQSHISESLEEVSWSQELHPERAGYLDVYEHYGQLGPRAIFGHGIHLTESELRRCHETGTALAHCPTSNLFLGSGLFDVAQAKNADRPVRVGLASDLGAGTSFSMLQTMNEAYKVAQLKGFGLSAYHAFYLATRGTAKALYLDDKIGSVAVGMEADLVVLDLHSTAILKRRMSFCESLEERLFVLMTMGDDRATLATYVSGKLVYQPSGAC
ncbi:MAG: guanine deaminase [Pseudohongiellaceae bacterium]|jgi:guanine deaminase